MWGRNDPTQKRDPLWNLSELLFRGTIMIKRRQAFFQTLCCLLQFYIFLIESDLLEFAMRVNRLFLCVLFRVYAAWFVCMVPTASACIDCLCASSIKLLLSQQAGLCSPLQKALSLSQTKSYKVSPRLTSLSHITGNDISEHYLLHSVMGKLSIKTLSISQWRKMQTKAKHL